MYPMARDSSTCIAFTAHARTSTGLKNDFEEKSSAKTVIPDDPCSSLLLRTRTCFGWSSGPPYVQRVRLVTSGHHHITPQLRSPTWRPRRGSAWLSQQTPLPLRIREVLVHDVLRPKHVASCHTSFGVMSSRSNQMQRPLCKPVRLESVHQREASSMTVSHLPQTTNSTFGWQ